jgi:mxaA protein
MIRTGQAWHGRRFLLVLLWLLPLHLQAETIIKRMEVSNPRPFGHVIGDTLQQKINLEIAKPYQLDGDSFPEAGPSGRWLEMRTPVIRARHGRSTTSYEILLTYQTFYLAERQDSLLIPPLEFRIGNGERILPLRVPEWRFWVTPLAPRGTGASVTASGLRPDHPPPAMPLRPYAYRITGLSFCLLAILLYLVYMRWGIPFLAQRKRPFAASFRHLKKLERKPCTDARYRDALRSLHRAFNRTAGWTVLSGNLELFFARHPEFASLRSPIETLFLQSRSTFFEAHREAAADTDALRQLVQLCRRCRGLERGVI